MKKLLLTVITLGLANLTPTNVVLPNQCWGNQSRIKTTSQKGQSCIQPLNQEDAGDEVEAIVKVGRDDRNIGNILVYRTGGRNYVLVSQFYPECLTTGYLSTKLRKSPLTRSCCIPSAGIDNIICGVHWVVELWNTSSDDKLTLKEACECLTELKNTCLQKVNPDDSLFKDFIKNNDNRAILHKLVQGMLLYMMRISHMAKESVWRPNKSTIQENTPCVTSRDWHQETINTLANVGVLLRSLFIIEKLNKLQQANLTDSRKAKAETVKKLSSLLSEAISSYKEREKLAKYKTSKIKKHEKALATESIHEAYSTINSFIHEVIFGQKSNSKPQESVTNIDTTLKVVDEYLYYALKSVFNLFKNNENTAYELSQIEDYCNHAMHTEVQVMVAEAAFGWTTSLPVYSTKLPCWSCVRIPGWKHEFHAYWAGVTEHEIPYYPVCFYIEPEGQQRNQETRPTDRNASRYQLPKEKMKGFDAQCTLHATTQNDVDYATKSRWTAPL